MHLARVTGAVVSTQKSPSLIGKKLLLVRRISADGELPLTPLTGDEVAVDSVGAGVGELVLLSSGSSARHVFSGPNEAIDLAVVGIVDTLSRYGAERWQFIPEQVIQEVRLYLPDSASAKLIYVSKPMARWMN